MPIFVLTLVTLAAWVALYVVVIRPKLASYRYTAGVYARLDAIEADGWTKALLWLKGLKVLILGVVTSMLPFAGTLYPQLAGFDWTAFFPSERAKVIAGLVTLAGVIGPMLMVVLHNGALAEASAAEPVQPSRREPDQPSRQEPDQTPSAAPAPKV